MISSPKLFSISSNNKIAAYLSYIKLYIFNAQLYVIHIPIY